MSKLLRRFAFLAVAIVAMWGIAQAQDVPVFYTADLSGENVVPAVETEANGQAMALLVDGTLYVGGTYSGLSSPIATGIRGGVHVHVGEPGENGPIVFELNNEGGTSGTFDGRFELTAEQVDTLAAGNFYIQIHTENNNPGELRGAIVAVAE